MTKVAAKTLKTHKKLIAFSEREWNVVLKHAHEKKFKSTTAAIKDIVLEKEKSDLDQMEEFLNRPKINSILKKLADV